MAKPRLFLFGAPEIERDTQVTRLTLRKAIALIAYLAVEARGFTRDYLAALLWPDLGASRALANLRRTISVVRTTLENGCIKTDGDLVHLDLTQVDVDVGEFRELCRREDGHADLERLTRASELFRGSFLEGFNLGDCADFDEWQDAVRENLNAELDSVLQGLSLSHLHSGEPELALPFAWKWLQLDQLNEAAHRVLMEIYAQTGRPELARRQYETCARILAREGIELDQETRDLLERLGRNGHGSKTRPTQNAAAEISSPAERSAPLDVRARRRRRIVAVAAASIIAVSLTVAISANRAWLFPADLSVADVQVEVRDQSLASVRFTIRNRGHALRAVAYSVFFETEVPTLQARDYLVFSEEIRVGRNSETTIERDLVHFIDPYTAEHQLVIPPGNYTASVVVDPANATSEKIRVDNQGRNGTLFSYPGTGEAETIEVQVSYQGHDALDDRNPLRIFLADISHQDDIDDWGIFTVSRPGRYFLPVVDIPRIDTDGSGYYLFVVHDISGDMVAPNPRIPGARNEVAALYREEANNLVYGKFLVNQGSPVYPGPRHVINFTHPEPPGPDDFEQDDRIGLGTVISYDDLPVRQHHTFHDEGTGDIDFDWFEIFLETGDSLVIETLYAGGLWMSDTQVDIADAQNYITSNMDKTFGDQYSLLVYVNDTGEDQMFNILIKPSDQYNRDVRSTGEYLVEFRK